MDKIAYGPWERPGNFVDNAEAIKQIQQVIDGSRDTVNALVEEHKKLFEMTWQNVENHKAHLRQSKPADPKGHYECEIHGIVKRYYWCAQCGKVIEKSSIDFEGDRHEGNMGWYSHHVTGPHYDTCPYPGCDDIMQPLPTNIFGVKFRMQCSQNHFMGPLEPTEEEATHAWRKDRRMKHGG